MSTIKNALALSVLCIAMVSPNIANAAGHFVGRVAAAWDNDGRDMTLIEPFAYVDKNGVRWEAPTGSLINGASIPRAGWAIVGGPYSGKYRDASVIHDVACDAKSRSWQDVHRAFYEAMIDSGEDVTTAKLMYAAVYKFGPRWPRPALQLLGVEEADVPAKSNLLESMTKPGDEGKLEVSYSFEKGEKRSDLTLRFQPLRSSISDEQFEQLKKDIREKNLSLEQIESYGESSMIH